MTPHRRLQGAESDPDQLHIARYDFGPIEIDRNEVIEIAELIQNDFNSSVVVTVAAETEQSCYLNHFKTLSFSEDYAKVVKITAQESERGNISRVIQVEFGPLYNFVVTQSSDEVWVRGKRDILRDKLRSYERSYATLFRRFGFGINQIIFVGLLVFLPSLSSNWYRAILVFGVVLITQILNYIDSKVLRHASIRLRVKRRGLADKLGPSFLSWLAGLIGTVLAGLLLFVLQGALGIPFGDPRGE